MIEINKKMLPRHADGLHVVVIGRVSTIHQDIGNLEAGYAYAEQSLRGICDGPIQIRRFGEQCSGMIVDRQTLNQACALIESGWADLVLMEDLSKSHRNPRWMFAFVQDCVDAGVRVIAPGDSFDTWSTNWELMLSAAAMRHGMHIPDTRRRVRRTATASFHNGGMVQRVRYGYEKLTPDQAKARRDHPDKLLIAKIPECTSIIKHLQHLVVVERLYGQPLVEWLESQGESPGPYVEDGRWKWDIVKDLLRDPILMGWRTFRKTKYEPIFSTGRHRRERNSEPDSEFCECLAHLTKEQFEALQLALDELEPPNRPTGSDHPRYRVRRKDSVMPQQHAVCAICKAYLYPSGAGGAKCKNTTKDATKDCWNHVQIDLELTRERVIDLLLSRLQNNPQAMKVMTNSAWQEYQRQHAHAGSQMQSLDEQIRRLEREAAKMIQAIKSGISLDGLADEAQRVQDALKAAKTQRQRLQSGKGQTSVPESLDQFMANPSPLLLDLARTSFEFGDLMRRVIPRFEIQPVHAIDTGQVRPRALLTLDLAAAARPAAARGEPVVGEDVAIDLFDPPVHIAYLDEIVTAAQTNPTLSLKKVAALLKGRVTYMTVKRSLDYWKRMQSQGLTEPYRVLQEAPASASRWKIRMIEGVSEDPDGQAA